MSSLTPASILKGKREMKTAYIIHGVTDAEEYLTMNFPSLSNAHWFPWLQQKFLRAGVLCQCLEMPTPYNPSYAEWKSVWDHTQIDNTSVIVGHSAGCGFILKWLSENRSIQLSKLVLVAPWLDPYRDHGDFLVFELDQTIQDRVDSIHVLYSENEDIKGVIEIKESILKTFPKAIVHKFKNYGHFIVGTMGTTEFHELWEIVK